MSVAEISCGDIPVAASTNTSATTSTGTRYRDTVTYTCATGYEMISGSDTITCLANKEWSATPVCSSE